MLIENAIGRLHDLDFEVSETSFDVYAIRDEDIVKFDKDESGHIACIRHGSVQEFEDGFEASEEDPDGDFFTGRSSRTLMGALRSMFARHKSVLVADDCGVQVVLEPGRTMRQWRAVFIVTYSPGDGILFRSFTSTAPVALALAEDVLDGADEGPLLDWLVDDGGAVGELIEMARASAICSSA